MSQTRNHSANEKVLSAAREKSFRNAVVVLLLMLFSIYMEKYLSLSRQLNSTGCEIRPISTKVASFCFRKHRIYSKKERMENSSHLLLRFEKFEKDYFASIKVKCI